MMKKALILLLACSLLLCACGKKEEAVSTPEPTPVPTPEATPEPTPEATPEPTPALPYTAEEIMEYFCEVALSAEYHTGEGNHQVLQKWKRPIKYCLLGELSGEDQVTLDVFVSQLNEIEGFPGMYLAEESEANLKFRFLGREEHRDATNHIVNGEETDGVASWTYYNDTNEIYEAKIWIRNDIGQDVRNAVILEEIVNTLGLRNDSLLRPDSIIYQGYSVPTGLTEMDWILLRTLYSENIKCGMNEERCCEVIKQMYG